jgi:2-polyprenyl-3-methyl-5-hydroxy-6-metoxy-1,4-benzoquinol methylase
MTTVALDQAKAEAFAAKMIEVLNSAGVALMVSIGHRTGLFECMAGLRPSTAFRIAEAAGLNERYVKEWLGAMVTGGVVEHNPENDTFWLLPEHAPFLTRAGCPNNLASPMQWVAVLGAVEDKVAEAFRHGRGVPYSSYPRFHEVMAEESFQTVVAGLEQHILPLVPGLPDQLREGIEVLDVGCGRGLAILKMAELYAASRFHGYDFSSEAIEFARQEARSRHLKNITFEALDVAKITDDRRYDLVTAFDAIHDQVDPAAVLRGIARALKPEGVFLMQDIKACSTLHENRGLLLGPFIYAISCMHCMSVSLANGGAGLGAAWGKERALSMLAKAGFEDVQVETLPHDILNYYYVARLGLAPL